MTSFLDSKGQIVYVSERNQGRGIQAVITVYRTETDNALVDVLSLDSMGVTQLIEFLFKWQTLHGHAWVPHIASVVGRGFEEWANRVGQSTDEATPGEGPLMSFGHDVLEWQRFMLEKAKREGLTDE